MEKCRICGSSSIAVIYDDYIRDGGLGTLTKEKFKMYQCEQCETIWHTKIEDSLAYYQSTEYRQKLENAVDIESYYRAHDKEVLEKLQYTGTDIYRNKVVADIGCGGGSFLDFISGAADAVIAIEPSSAYRMELSMKKYHVFPYASGAIKEWEGKVDVVTSFDVIEHVDDPVEFMRDVYGLLKSGGKAVIGTPSECPVMRRLLGNIYEKKLLFSYQHPWILSKESFRICCKQAGFAEIRIESKQRYGMSNMISWLIEKTAKGHCHYEFVTETLDNAYKKQLEEMDNGDYWVAYVVK